MLEAVVNGIEGEIPGREELLPLLLLVLDEAAPLLVLELDDVEVLVPDVGVDTEGIEAQTEVPE